jgi:hypothetical protein
MEKILMIIGYNSAILKLEAVYATRKGYGAKEDYYTINKVLTHPSIGIYGAEMCKIDITTWELTNITCEFSKHDFMEGSGFGGGPYLVPDFFLKIQNGAVYRSLM